MNLTPNKRLVLLILVFAYVQGWVLDGYPRTISQSEALERLLTVTNN